MKFSIVAALVVLLAVAHGSEAKSLVRRDVKVEMENMVKLLKEMSASITTATQDMVEKVQAMELANNAQTYIDNSRTKIQPLVEQVQAEATKLQEQVKPFITNIDDHLKPLTDNFNAQVKPLTDNFYAQVKPLTNLMEQLFQQVAEQTKALVAPQ